MASDPDFPIKLDADSDSDSDPEFQAKLDAEMDHYLRFDRSTRDRSVPLTADEIMEEDRRNPPDPKKLQRLEERLMNLVPTFFRTRDARRDEASKFLRWVAEPDYPVAKACTWSCGDQLLSETWLGITWVALQRKDESLCVVVRNTDLLNFEQQLRQCINGEPIRRFLVRFWTTIISHVEDTKEEVCGSSSTVQSFAVVAVAAASKDPEAITEAVNLAEKTSKFFLEKLKNGISLTSEETVLTAIMATQYLFQQEFKADELRVFLWEKEEHIAEEVLLNRKEDLDLDLDIGLDLEELLACMDAERRCLGAAAHCS